jgi:HK97 family phage major capsid protein
MPAHELSAEDQAVIAELRRNWRDEINAAIAPMQQQILAVGQRTSRGPGSNGLEHAAPYTETLSKSFFDDPLAAAWFKNPQPGGLKVELARAPLANFCTKGTPITGPGLPSFPVIRPAIATQPRRRFVLRDVLSVFPLTSGNGLTYLVETPPVPAVPSANYQLNEGDVKAEISILTAAKTSTPKTIAAWTSASTQVMGDVSYLMQYIDGRLTYELAFCEERELLNGDGTPGKILGLLAQATAYDTTRTLAGDQLLDIVSHAATQLAEADVYATAVVVNPGDAEQLRLVKTSVGEYVWADSDATTADGGTLWGLTPIVTNSMVKGSFLVGDFGPSAAQIIERQAAILAISFEHADFFTRNLAALRVEERIDLAVYQPFAFCKGVFPPPRRYDAGYAGCDQRQANREVKKNPPPLARVPAGVRTLNRSEHTMRGFAPRIELLSSTGEHIRCAPAGLRRL